MKTAKLTLMFLACAAAIPAFAQNTTDSRCGSTNYDSSRDMYTITNPTLATATQQCFITVVPKSAWPGGNPNLSTSQLIEGNYEITLSGGGGGGGGGAGNSAERHHRTEAGDGGHGGFSAVPSTTVRYLAPGVYRLTIGSGGVGGMAGAGSRHHDGSTAGGSGSDGGPTSLANAYSGETVAGFSGAESWNGSYPLVAQAAYVGAPAKDGQHGVDGGSGGGSGGSVAERGAQGGNGYIKLALKDSVTQAAPVQAAPAMSNETVTTPAREAARPARKDRN